MSILITGFKPFAGEIINPSWQVAQALHGRKFDNLQVHAHCLPTVFGQSLQTLEQLIAQYKPAIIICFGQAAGRCAVSLERVAINIDDARIADNLGQCPIDHPIHNNGPNAYFSSLPIKAIVQELQHSGIPAEVSNSAGTFVCNHVFYGLMHITEQQKNVRAGFVHIPFLPEQAVHHKGAACLSLALLIEAAEIIVRATLQHSQDLTISGGLEC
jgi:pyroglutamyl-peptidase